MFEKPEHLKVTIDPTPATFEDAIQDPENMKRLVNVSLSEAAGATLAEKKKIVSPWEENKTWSKYTSEGTALNIWRKIELEQRVADAIEFIKNEDRPKVIVPEVQMTPRTKLKMEIKSLTAKKRKPRKMPALLEPDRLSNMDSKESNLNTAIDAAFDVAGSTSAADQGVTRNGADDKKKKTKLSSPTRKLPNSLLSLFPFKWPGKKAEELDIVHNAGAASVAPSTSRNQDDDNFEKLSTKAWSTPGQDLVLEEIDGDNDWQDRGFSDDFVGGGGEDDGEGGVGAAAEKSTMLNSRSLEEENNAGADDSSTSQSPDKKKNPWALRMPFNLYASVSPSAPLTADALSSPFRRMVKPNSKWSPEALALEEQGQLLHPPSKAEAEEVKADTDARIVNMKKLTFEQRVVMYRAQLGGQEKLDKMAESWTNYAAKVRKESKRQHNYFDFSLDLADACRNGDFLKVGAILAAGAEPNQEIDDVPLFLFVAGKIIFLDVDMGLLDENDSVGPDQKNLQRVCELLLKFNCKPDKKGPDGMNAMHVAAASGDTRFVKWLCQKGCNPDVMSRDELSPLMYAAKYGHSFTMAPLVLAGANLNAVDLNKRTALHYAAMTGQTRTAQFLIRVGANKAAADLDGLNPGQLASVIGYRACAQAICAFSRPRIKAEPQLTYMVEEHRAKTTAASRPVTVMFNALQDSVNFLGSALSSASRAFLSLFG